MAPAARCSASLSFCCSSNRVKQTPFDLNFVLEATPFSLENPSKFAPLNPLLRGTRNALSVGGLSAPGAAGGARSPVTHRTFLRAASSRVALALRPRVGSDAFALQPPWKARLQPRAPGRACGRHGTGRRGPRRESSIPRGQTHQGARDSLHGDDCKWHFRRASAQQGRSPGGR